MLRALLAALLAAATARTHPYSTGGRSGSSSGSGSGYHAGHVTRKDIQDCMFQPINGSLLAFIAELGEIVKGNQRESDVQWSRFDQDAEADFMDLITRCLDVCPMPETPDVRFSCREDYHAYVATFNGETKYHAALQWQVFFLCFFLLLGALCRRCLPTWMPYTVGLLVISFLMGGAAQVPISIWAPGCPSHLMMFDYDHDHYLNRTEFDHSQCVGCDPNAFCTAARSESGLNTD